MNKDRISSIFWFIFSVYTSYKSYKLGLGILFHPGPGFLFFWTGILVAILSATVFIKTFMGQEPKKSQESPTEKWKLKKTILVLISLFIYALLIEWIGFIIITFFLFIFLLVVIEKKKWWFAVSVSIIVTGSAYLIFELGLQSQLPKGFLGF
jgi:putative tricarboxylic transport membrane protein